MPVYTSRIIKASALIADTKALLAYWDLGRSAADNLEQARQQNILGKASRKRTEDVLLIFRQRYFDAPDVGAALVTLVQGGAPAQWVIRHDDRLPLACQLFDNALLLAEPDAPADLDDLPAPVGNRREHHIAVMPGEAVTAVLGGRGPLSCPWLL